MSYLLVCLNCDAPNFTQSVLNISGWYIALLKASNSLCDICGVRLLCQGLLTVHIKKKQLEITFLSL